MCSILTESGCRSARRVDYGNGLTASHPARVVKRRRWREASDQAQRADVTRRPIASVTRLTGATGGSLWIIIDRLGRIISRWRRSARSGYETTSIMVALAIRLMRSTRL
jgi:hypothetical protein